MLEVCLAWWTEATTGTTLVSLMGGLMLPVLSALGVFFSTGKSRNSQLFGYMVGLLAQPLWYLAAIEAHNLGMFINVNLFTALWIYRIYGLRRKHGKV